VCAQNRVDGAAEGGADAASDAGSIDGGPRRVTTVEGELTCGDARSRIEELLDEATSSSNACSGDQDCVCARTVTECEGRCETPINSERAQDFAESLEEISAFFGTPSACPCGYTDDDCSACFAACVMGRCSYGLPVTADDAGAD
jgi:hypothetical protein